MSYKQTSSEQLNSLLNDVKNDIPEDLFSQVSEYIENQEWGLGYETLCVQIYEFDIPITSEFYKKLALLGEKIGIDSNMWLPLKELIKNDQ